jgi:hypothetical protein
VLGASADARVRNSDAASGEAYRTQNYGDLTTARIGRTPGTAAGSAQYDYATYLKFDVGAAGRSAHEYAHAVLQVTGRSMTQSGGSPGPILFHVYALADDAWHEDSITWATAPNLLSTDAKLTRVGTTAFPVGQLTFDSGTAAQTIGIDLTKFLADHPELFGDGLLSFALVREERFTGDADAAGGFVELFTRESGQGPTLTLFVPEPGSLAMIALVGVGMLGRRRR